jgi:type I restriction enzyme S subunit
LITEYKRDLIDTSFLYYLFNTRDVRLQIRATASGVKVRHTSPSRIGEVKVRIPSVSTQHKVASILSAYDDLIENNTRRIAILEAMVQTIYREWFVDFRFPGHEKVKLVDLPLGKIPEGWVMKTLGTVVSLRTEGVVPSDYPEEVFAHYSFPAFDAGVLPSLECGSTIKSNKHIVQDNCVLLAKLNPRIPRIWLPYLGGSWRPICSTEFLVVVPDTLVTKEFLYCLFQSCTFRDAFGGGAIGTSTSHQRVKPDDFKGRQLLVPPPEVVHSFTEMVLPILRLQHTMRIRNVNLRTTRDLLLPKLISGQLDVEDLDIETGQTVTMTE